MSGFGLTKKQQDGLVIIYEDREVIRDVISGNFIGTTRRPLQFNTVMSLFDRRLVRVFLKNYGVSRQPKFSATISETGEAVIRSMKRRQNGKEQAAHARNEALQPR